MTYNVVKLIVAAVLAVVLVVAIVIDPDGNGTWAVPLLTLLIGYVIGNAEVTNRAGATSPIVSAGERQG